MYFCFFFSSRRRHTRFDCDWSSDVCSSDLFVRSGYTRENSYDVLWKGTPSPRGAALCVAWPAWPLRSRDRKSTRLNSSHSQISYAVFCLKKKNMNSLPCETQKEMYHWTH